MLIATRMITTPLRAISRSAFSLLSSSRNRSIFNCSGFIISSRGALNRIEAELLPHLRSTFS